jgi:acyl-CoA synthetase (AMP-forming)/AMP-acid ligase II
MFRAYRDEGPEGRSVLSNGWLPTGDWGSWDPSTGSLTVDGRGDDVVITGGHKVWPDQVERILERHESVAAAVVVGVPDERWGHVVTAVIELTADGAHHPPRLEELRAAVGAELPRYCEPRALRVFDRIPRAGTAGSGLGKPSRATTRARLASQ